MKTFFAFALVLGATLITAQGQQTNKTPILRGILQTDFDANGKGITNAATLQATNIVAIAPGAFQGDGSLLTGITAAFANAVAVGVSNAWQTYANTAAANAAAAATNGLLPSTNFLNSPGGVGGSFDGSALNLGNDIFATNAVFRLKIPENYFQSACPVPPLVLCNSRSQWWRETNFVQAAQEMLSNGLYAAGFRTICMDDSWQVRSGTNLVTTNGFTGNSLTTLADILHTNGFKFWSFADMSTQSVSGYAASKGFVRQDALTYAGWKIDGVKLTGDYRSSGSATNYENSMVEFENYLFQACPNPIMVYALGNPFEIPPANFHTDARKWSGIFYGNAGLVDYINSFTNFLKQFDAAYPLTKMVGPGHYLSYETYEWPGNLDQGRAIWGGVMVMSGYGLISDNPTHLEVLTNIEVNAIGQDPLVMPASLYSSTLTNGTTNQIFLKHIRDVNGNEKAVYFLNRDTNAWSATLSLTNVFPGTAIVTIRDLWAQTNIGYATNTWTTTVPAQGSVLVKITRGYADVIGANWVVSSNWVVKPNYGMFADATFGDTLDNGNAESPFLWSGTLRINQSGSGAIDFDIPTWVTNLEATYVCVWAGAVPLTFTWDASSSFYLHPTLGRMDFNAVTKTVTFPAAQVTEFAITNVFPLTNTVKQIRLYHGSAPTNTSVYLRIIKARLKGSGVPHVDQQ